MDLEDLPKDEEYEQALQAILEEIRGKVKAREEAMASAYKKARKGTPNENRGGSTSTAKEEGLAKQIQLLQEAGVAFGKLVHLGLGNGGWRSAPYSG